MSNKIAGVPRKYASSLYAAAKRVNKLDAVEKDMQTVKELYTSNRNFAAFVKNPTLNRNLKQATLKDVLKASKVTAESQQFLGVLAENGRLGLLNAVINHFEDMVRSNRGDLSVEIVSAEELNANTKKSITDALGRGGKSLNVSYQVRPEVIGGIVVQIGDRRLDLSIASRVKKLTAAIQGTV